MKPSVALNEKRDEVREALRRYRVANPRVFGSVARGQDGETSDFDLVVDPLPGLSLFDLGGLQSELERLLGCDVDVVLSEGLHRRIRTRVLAEAQPLIVATDLQPLLHRLEPILASLPDPDLHAIS